MRNFDISKIFWSKCRTKILEKFLLEYEFWNNEWFHMRLIARDLDEQINSIKRELDSLEDLWILKSKEDNKKKIFYVNKNFFLLEEFKSIFMKSYDPSDSIKSFFKNQESISLAIINSELSKRLVWNTNNIVDIFLIWEINKISFNEFLAKTFFNRKIKYAILNEDDFVKRLEFNDKLVINILKQNWNIFVIDKIWAKDFVLKN